MKRTIIALDVDGTLKDYGGVISEETIERLKPLTHIGICSSRNDAWEIAKKYGLGFGETGKSSCLQHFRELWGKDCVGLLYIGDSKQDEEEARKAGWNFVYVNDIKLNVGSGEDIRFGYINIDIRPVKGTNLILDLEKQDLPFEDDIISEIVAQDVLEHIEYDRVEHVVKEFYRVLKPKGRLIVRVPDIIRIVSMYADDYKKMSYFIFGGKKHEYDVHKTAFTKYSLSRLLRTIGFRIKNMWNDGTNLIIEAYK